MPLAPPLNGHVEVAVPGVAGWLPSRVEDVDDATFVLARPTLADGSAAPVRDGDLVELRWMLERGVARVAARLVETAEGPLPRWRVTAATEGEVEQRRRFVRTPVFHRAIVRLAGAEHTAVAVDLSEGGVRCSDSHAPELAPGTQLEIVLDLDGTTVEVVAQVVRRGGGDGPQWWAARFLGASRQTADVVRRFVFSTQSRNRARGDR